MHILVCGGAGYIGSHMAEMLAGQNHKVTVFDNLSTGHQEAVQWGEFVHGDLLNVNDLINVFQSGKIDAVMHFSAKSLVGESISEPALYYSNNVTGTLNLLEVMRKFEVAKIIFSSSAATFGNPLKDRIDESHPQAPINPYGETKLMVERILKSFDQAYGLRSVSLRYFNAAGADLDGKIGESHDPETHLIPNVLKSILAGGSKLKVFGGDYDTLDGTCVRDYIHISDLCTAHLQALDYMAANQGAHGFNLGNGHGFSILEVIKAAENVSKTNILFAYEDRRPGDPPTLVADSALAHKELGWQPKYTEIDQIISSAWNWHKDQKY